MSKDYKDVIYEVKDGVAHVIINRPKVYNAFRGQTLEEMIDALHRADEEEERQRDGALRRGGQGVLHRW